MSAIITLTTDFGLSDAYVASMKGVILGINHEVKLVDVCHSVRPQDILQGAFVLNTVFEYFPEGTIHLVVIDPGVGTERKAIILRTPAAYFVAPDNGVLSYIIEHFSGKSAEVSTGRKKVKLKPPLEAYTITNPRFWRPAVSSTFHGRDIFAPVVAWLSLGYQPAQLGDRITSVNSLPLLHPQRRPDGSLVGHIIHIDIFGNLVTNIRAEDLPEEKESVTINAGGHSIQGLSLTYAEREGLLALIGSSGYLEVSLNRGSAAHFLNADTGSEVFVN
jgi:S-adenosylmethionine hydrolase